MAAKDFSPYKFLHDPLYARKFRKYLKRNIFLDTFAFCLIVLGKFDDTYSCNTLGGEPASFMNIQNKRKLLRILERYKGKLLITPAVVLEGLRHMFDAVETQYRNDPSRKKIENCFVTFLQKEIKIFKERHPTVLDMLTHNWTEELKHHKLRSRFEMGDLSIFVASDNCSYSTIITKDAYKKDKSGLQYLPDNKLIFQLEILDVL